MKSYIIKYDPPDATGTIHLSVGGAFLCLGSMNLADDFPRSKRPVNGISSLICFTQIDVLISWRERPHTNPPSFCHVSFSREYCEGTLTV